MIIPAQWSTVPAGARVILSSGRTVRALSVVPVGDQVAVTMADADGKRANIVVADGPVPMIYDELDAAVAALKQSFRSVEYVRDI